MIGRFLKKVYVKSNNVSMLDARIEDDPKKAIKILELLAETGESEAEIMLGYIYQTGDVNSNYNVIKKDINRAEYWYKRAAANRNPQGHLNLLWLYQEIGAVAKWKDQAHNAANSGVPDAMRQLGFAYINGMFSLSQNFQAGVKWLKTAAKLHDHYAQESMGEIYNQNKFIQKDIFKAYVWYSLAAISQKKYAFDNYERELKTFNEPKGSKYYELMRPKYPDQNKAEIARDILLTEMSSEQIKKAQMVVEKSLSERIITFD